MSLIPNIPPKLFSGSAVAVGYLLIDDLTANEQNALGNWLMLVAQVLSTNAFYKQVMVERGLDNEYTSGSNSNNKNNAADIRILEKMIEAMEKEISKLRSEIYKNDN